MPRAIAVGRVACDGFFLRVLGRLVGVMAIGHAALACSSSSAGTPPPDAGGPLPCVTNADCPGGGVCTSDPACGADCSFSCHSACDPGNACGAGQWCRIEPFSHASFCATRASEGGACAANENVDSRETTNDSCAEGTWCDRGTCKAQSAPGADCSVPFAPFECPAGFACNAAGSGALACHPLASTGAACADDRDCDAASYCDDATQACVARVAPGGACDESSEYMCAVGSDCKFTTIGECTKDADCTGGSCCAMPNGQGLCTDSSTIDCSLPKGVCM